MKNSKIWKKITEILGNRSMTTQLIITIVLIFLSFFALQWLLNDQFFQNYYTEQQFNEIYNELTQYVTDMNEDDADYFEEMYEFTQDKNIYTVVVARSYRLQSSGYSEYSLEMEDAETDTIHSFLIPNNDYQYTVGENIDIEAYKYTADIYSPVRINTDNYTYNNGIICTDNCKTVSGPILDINKPVNLNYQFENNTIVRQELNKFSSGTIELPDDDEWYYIAEYDTQNYLVFIHKLGTFDLIFTIIPIESSDSIISIVSSYNNWVYVTAIAIIFIWSFRLSNILSKPVQNIENVAREIAVLNFNVEAKEFNNRENKSLSNSINLIARNLKETLDTLNNQNDELMALYDEQVKQVSLKKQLVSSISHELKTPLMIMQVTIQGILDGIISPEDQVKELNNVIDEINKSSLMIGDMLQIYRLEDANTTLELSEFNLSDIVMFFINDFENVLKKHELKIDLNLDSTVFVEADMKLLKRCISNFFTNAIRYTPDKGKIYIETSQDEESVYFELTNYGVKIPDLELENIWLPFFRGQQANTSQKLKTKGSGIGLYLVSEILKAHNAEFGIGNIDDGVKAYFRINKKQSFK